MSHYQASEDWKGVKVTEHAYGEHRRLGIVVDFAESAYGTYNVVLFDDGTQVNVPSFTSVGIGYHLQLN
jgi:hypothetical protein